MSVTLQGQQVNFAFGFLSANAHFTKEIYSEAACL